LPLLDRTRSRWIIQLSAGSLLPWMAGN